MNIIIVGDGKVGATLTHLLSAEGHDVTVVDSNLRVLERAQEENDVMVIHGHGASKRVLEEAGADEADLLVAATSSDEVNLLACLMGRKLGCERTIARVRNLEYADDIGMLREELGLSFSVNPEDACAREIFSLLQFPSFLGREQFARGKVEIVRLKICENSPFVNLPLSDLYQTVKIKVLVCAVDRQGEIYIPDGGFVVQEGDEIYITAMGSTLARLIRNLNLPYHRVSHVTIVGGSKIAYYLAKRLVMSHVRVRIVEKDQERCEILSELLPEADILEGDGTDKEMLLSEGVMHSDALVTLTGMDEENIVLSLYAKQSLHIPVVITKCGRNQYREMFRQMGLDAVVSPQVSCSEEVVRYVRAMQNSFDSDIVTMHSIADGQVEALEFIADNNTRLLNTPLSKLKLKKGILIVCINHHAKTIIPNGDSVVRHGDSVIVVTTGHCISDLNDILAG